MKCFRHRKDVTSKCLWCGGALCVDCIAKKDGKKSYCEKCAVALSSYKVQERQKQPTLVRPSEQKSEQVWTSKN